MGHLSIEVLSLLADEMLEQRKAEECHRHIATCKVCEQMYDDMLAMSFAMAKLEIVAPTGGYEDFTQGIMANLPAQDEVSDEKTVDIQEHRVKQDFFASINWSQVMGYGAMVAILVTMFLPKPQESEIDSPVMFNAGLECPREQTEASDTTAIGGEMMMREMEEPGAEQDREADAVSMATPSASVVEDYSPDDLATAWSAMTYSGVAGVSLTEEQSLDVVRLLLDLREKSGENFWPVVLHLAEENGELEGSWGKWEDFSFTTRSYEEISPYWSLFPFLDEDSEYLLITSG